MKAQKKLFITLVFITIGFFGVQCSNKVITTEAKSSNINLEERDTIKCLVQTYYGYHKDKKPGRQITVVFNEKYFSDEATLDLLCEGNIQTYYITFEGDGTKEQKILLPYKKGVEKDCKATINVKSGKTNISKTLNVPKCRYWTVMIYPHSHVDIGYTNTHEQVELIHRRNIKNGLRLAKETKDYPEGARYVWNPEVIWPVEKYMQKATTEQKEKLIDGVKKGYLSLDAGYVNVNTSITGDEELLELVSAGKKYEKMSGKKIETLVQVDIPGISWGFVPVAAKLGIKYCLLFNNGIGRIGSSYDEVSFRPFWWEDAQGKNRVLVIQPGTYAPGAQIKGKYFYPEILGEQDSSKIMEVVKTDNPRENFIDDYINEKLPELEKSDYYPYDVFLMAWSMADNMPLDADLPEAVKSWNEEYAYPKLKISGSSEMMKYFDDNYGDEIPVRRGDFTEYWTDGLGSAAKQTAMNRSTKERLIQTEALWTMLNTDNPAPRREIEQTWKNIILGSEHTWCYINPEKEPITTNILESKFKIFQNAEDQSIELLENTISEIEKTRSTNIAVFNTLSWKRGGVASISSDLCEDYNSVLENNGDKIISQKLSSGEIIFKTNSIPGFGANTVKLSSRKNNSDENMANENVLDNGIVRLEIDKKTGDISSFKLRGTEFVDKSANCNINSFRYLKQNDESDDASKLKNVKIYIKENGPLLATIVVKADAEMCKSVITEYTIYAGSDEIEIKNVVDKTATTKKEGVHFGFAFDIDKPKIINDIPWGTMEVEKDQMKGSNKNWLATQHWLNISNNSKGIIFCPLDAPVFEVDDMTANIAHDGMGEEAKKWIDKLDVTGTIFSWALNNHWYTNFPLSQEGKLVFRYHIKPYLKAYDYSEVNKYGTEQYRPLVTVPVKENFKIEPLLEIENNENIEATIFKTSDNGRFATLRLRSLSDNDEEITLNWKSRQPSKVILFDIKDNSEIEEIKDNKFNISKKDFVTLKVVW